MLMTNGIGASVGTFLAGTCVVNKLVMVDGLSPEQQLAGWRESWFIFAAYALVVAVLFWIVFRDDKSGSSEVGKALETAEEPGGMTDDGERI